MFIFAPVCSPLVRLSPRSPRADLRNCNLCYQRWRCALQHRVSTCIERDQRTTKEKTTTTTTKKTQKVVGVATVIAPRRPKEKTRKCVFLRARARQPASLPWCTRERPHGHQLCDTNLSIAFATFQSAFNYAIIPAIGD